MTTHAAPKLDNLLGVCHGMGETLGFNPLYLRLAFLVGIMLAPQATLVTYSVAGIAVLTSRLATRSTHNQQRVAALSNA